MASCPRWRWAMRALVSGLAVAVLSGMDAARAQQFFDKPRSFVIDKPCTAYRSFKRSTDPLAVSPGETLLARGENRLTDPSHVFVRIGAGDRWVSLSCGHYADGGGPGGNGAPAAHEPRPAGTAPAQCLPFFDTEDNPVEIGFGGRVDITPPPPLLNDFDLAVNAACGEPGRSISEAEFKALLERHPLVLERIMDFTGRRVYADRQARPDPRAYLDQLAEAWLSLKAFDHIMCGEPGAGRNTIGGLHFYGRYLQLQNAGSACRMANHRQNEAVPGVLYTFGVMMRTPDGRIARHATKGYGLTLSAEDLFKVITRAFMENPTQSTSSTACLLPVADDGANFTAVFVRRRAGIRTFYPDGTPSKRDPACAHPIDLQEVLARDDATR